MKIAVVGATSQTGSELINQALAAGHEVVAYARRPEAVKPAPGLSIVGGQIDEVDKLSKAFTGCDAIVLIVGWKIGQPFVPLYSIAVPAVIAAANKVGVKRIIVQSVLGAGNTFRNTRYPYRLGCHTFLRTRNEDHHIGESQLIGSGLNWTTLHPGPLFNGQRTASPTIVDAASGQKMPGVPRTQRADVAAAMLNMIDDPTSFGKQMLISSNQSRE